MKSNPPDPELRSLIDNLLDAGPLSQAQMRRLEELLESPNALSYYLSVTSQEGFMPEALVPPETGQNSLRKKIFAIPFRRILQIAAMGTIFALGWWIGNQKETQVVAAPNVSPETDATPARITGLVGVEWQKGNAPDLLSRSGKAGRLAFKSGLVELTYESGVRVTIEGPADFSVIDKTSGKIASGKLVASVPKGAEGFRIDYANGNVVDLGTEFAMDISPSGKAEVGVLEGKINLNLPGDEPRLLLVNQAVLHDTAAAEPLQAIPLNRDKYVRRLPSRDFHWEVSSLAPQEIEFDVTHLIWKASQYRAIFKWMQGIDGIVVKNVTLLLDGEPVVSDKHIGSTGYLKNVKDNVFSLDLKPQEFREGRWTIRAAIEGSPRGKFVSGPVQSQGILQFEEGLVSKAGPADFIGKWSYHYLGNLFVREFHSDGSITLERDGVLEMDKFKDSKWSIEDGVLIVNVPKYNHDERHVLRNSDTLIFVSQPYDNATKLEGN